MARIIEDSEYRCTLSEATFEKAKAELGEDPSTRIILVKELRKRLDAVSGLKARTDICFLLPFMRARKYESERVYQLVKNYYEVRKNSDICKDLKPSKVNHVMEAGLIEVLKARDNNGCRVVVLRIGRWNPDKFPITDLPRALFLVMSKLVEDEETQVHGIHIVNNLADMTWKQAKHVTPAFAKSVMNIMQNVLPLRMKRLDYVNEPTFFDMVFSIVRQFMSDKLVSRIHLNGNTFEKLHTTINPDLLPTDLGGEVEPFNNMEFMDDFRSSDARFEEDSKFGYLDMTIQKSKDKQQQDADMQGMAGSFKKLDM